MVMILLAHNGVEDGHPDEAASPVIGMPEAPKINKTSQVSSIAAPQGSSNTPVFISAGIILLAVVVIVFYVFRTKKTKNA